MWSRLLNWLGLTRRLAGRPIDRDPRLAEPQSWTGTVLSMETYR